MEKHLDTLLDLAEKKDAIALGPGLGRERETLEVVRKLVARIDVPVIVDADGISAFAETQNCNSKVKNKNIIFTPHSGEMEVLSDKEIENSDLEQKIAIAKETALQHNTTILLKGSIDIITDGVEVVLNKTGSPYMTSGGTGDVLCGITGALAARQHAQSSINSPQSSMNFVQIASAAAYISGRAGEYAAEKFKDSLIATDVIEEIPIVLKNIHLTVAKQSHGNIYHPQLS